MSTLGPKASLSSSKPLIYARSQNQVHSVLNNAQAVLAGAGAAKRRIAAIDRELVAVELKQKSFSQVTSDITSLRDQKPEYLRQFYEQGLQMDLGLSEEEILASREYERSRLDRKLWAILEVARKKKLQELLGAGKFKNKKD